MLKRFLYRDTPEMVALVLFYVPEYSMNGIKKIMKKIIFFGVNVAFFLKIKYGLYSRYIE